MDLVYNKLRFCNCIHHKFPITFELLCIFNHSQDTRQIMTY